MPFNAIYLFVYTRPFQVTPLPDSTLHVEVNIIAANTAAPSGRVSAYHGDIPIPVETRARASITIDQRIRDWKITVTASQLPPCKYQMTPRSGQSGRISAATNARKAPNTPNRTSAGRSLKPR